MKIGLDFDGTITRDPHFWSLFIELSRAWGHEVTIVTFRQPSVFGGDENHDIEYYGEANDVKVVFTAGKQKAEAVPGIDVWIDDMPELIPAEIDLCRRAVGGDGDKSVPDLL